jgi:hypothetical protein
MKKHRAPTHPQTSIPGAVGSIFSPRDAVTGRAVPTDSDCPCGSNERVVAQEDDELVRRCKSCDRVISTVRPTRS